MPLTRRALGRAMMLLVAGALLAPAPNAAAAAAMAVADAPVLGKKGQLTGGMGWGRAHPKEIFNGGAPAGGVHHIRWRHWGAATATGTGLAPAYKPSGGYYADPVRVELRASRLARCRGSSRRAYTRLIVREQVRPRGPWGDWFPWALDLCDFFADPAPCGSVAFSPDNGDGAFEIGAWDTDCETARAVASDSRSVPIDPGPHADGTADYRLKSRGFACRGSSYDGDQPVQIRWSCLRGTAVVRWSAIGAPVAANTSADASRTRCKDVVLRTGDGSVYTRTRGLAARNTTCRTARRVARAFLHGSEGTGQVRPLGYRCTRDAEGVACRKRRKRVTWHW